MQYLIVRTSFHRRRIHITSAITIRNELLRLGYIFLWLCHSFFWETRLYQLWLCVCKGTLRSLALTNSPHWSYKKSFPKKGKYNLGRDIFAICAAIHDLAIEKLAEMASMTLSRIKKLLRCSHLILRDYHKKFFGEK